MGNKLNIEQQYLNLLKNVAENGVRKEATRQENGKTVKVENGTVALAHTMLQHDMNDGFPLMTHRKIPFKSTCVELEGFLKGITDKKWFEDRGCFYWRGWSNPQEVQDKIAAKYDSCGVTHDGDMVYGISDDEIKKIKRDTDDLGPLGYSWNWRKFGQKYINGGRIYGDGVEKGFDQVKDICDKIRFSPQDRRMVCSGWNPNQHQYMALPCCHVLWHVSVIGDTLNLAWFQRSVDIILGASANIASYAMLMLLLCEHSKGHTNLKPGTLTGYLGDVHIYDNQLGVYEEIMKRKTHPFPTIEFAHSGDLFDWTHDKVSLIGYMSEPKINTTGLVTI